MDDVEYRNRYEAGDMTEREELIYLKEENRRLREALEIIVSMATIENEDIIGIAEKALENG